MGGTEAGQGRERGGEGEGEGRKAPPPTPSTVLVVSGVRPSPPSGQQHGGALGGRRRSAHYDTDRPDGRPGKVSEPGS